MPLRKRFIVELNWTLNTRSKVFENLQNQLWLKLTQRTLTDIKDAENNDKITMK